MQKIIEKQILNAFENGLVLKIILKNNYKYTGKILESEENQILFKDKYGDEIVINIDSVASLIVIKGVD